MGANVSNPPSGEVKPTSSEFEWTIPNYLSLSEDSYSPSFSFAGVSWHFLILPNGASDDGRVTVCICRMSAVPPITLKVSFAIKTLDGKKEKERNYAKHIFLNGREIYAFSDCISKDELLKRSSELLPSNDFIAHFSMKQVAEDASGTATSLCSYCKNALDPESVSTHEKKCTERPIKCPDCSEVVFLQDWYGHECQVAKAEGDTATSLCSYCKNTLDAESAESQQNKCTERPIKCSECSETVLLQDWYGHECKMARTEEDGALIRDFKKMLSDGKNYDLILKIGDKELPSHRDILSCRSHVFESMLNHEMKEKNSGIIEMPDCDPEAMKLFLSYIYTGKVETLDQSHMLGLYYIADKYDTQGLKKVCQNFIKKSLSITNICQVIQLAVNHSDSSLLEYATEYFIENAIDITVTVEWQSFLQENSTLGNELIIKSFRKLKDVKS